MERLPGKEPKMTKHTAKSHDILDTIRHVDDIETGNIRYAEKQIPGARNHLTRTLLNALKLDAEKHHLIQRMVIDSIRKEAVNLSPDELQEFSGHLNKHIEAEERALCYAEEALEQSNLPVPRYLLSYLVTDIKMQNSLLSQFEDELKTASISTSISSKTPASPKAA